MVKAVAVVGLGLEHHRVAVSAGNRRCTRVPLNLHRTALHEGLLCLRRHGIDVFLEDRAYGTFRLLGIKLEVAGVGT